MLEQENGTVEFTKGQLEKMAALEKEFQEDTAVVSAAIQKYFEKYNSIICGVNARHLFGQWSITFDAYLTDLRKKAIENEKV